MLLLPVLLSAPSYQCGTHSTSTHRYGTHSSSPRRATLPRLNFFDNLLGKKDEDVPEDDKPLSAEAKRLRADKLKLQADLAELEARELKLQSASLAAPQPLRPPPPTTLSPPPPLWPAPSPTAPGSAPSAIALCDAIAKDTAGRLGERLEPMQALLLEAWSQGRAAQQAEIMRLKRQLDVAVKLQSARKPTESMSWEDKLTAAATLAEEKTRSMATEDGIESINKLLELSENRTNLNDFERRSRARALTKATFRLFQRLTTYDEEEDLAGDAAKVPVPGEGVVVISAARTRLRLLERHETAALVEYRLFASALAECEELERVAGTPTQLNEEAANANVTGFVGRWARLAFGNERWQQILQEEEDEEVKKQLQSSGSDLPVWLDLLSTQLTRSAQGVFQNPVIDIEAVADTYSFFPLLLAGLAARQGNLELFAVYYCARQLARINLMTLAEYEGRAAPMQPDQLASQQEALLVKRLFGSLVGYAGAAFFFGWVIVALLAGVAAWQLFSIGFDFLFAPPDPLAF
jgi:hypothetical protein